MEITCCKIHVYANILECLQSTVEYHLLLCIFAVVAGRTTDWRGYLPLLIEQVPHSILPQGGHLFYIVLCYQLPEVATNTISIEDVFTQQYNHLLPIIFLKLIGMCIKSHFIMITSKNV